MSGGRPYSAQDFHAFLARRDNRQLHANKQIESKTPMKLTSNKASVQYMKFNAIGDTAVGTFVSFERDVEGRFGPENVLILRGVHHERIVIRATAALSAIIDEHEANLAGRRLTITLVALRPTNKGSAMKVFDVEVDDDDLDDAREVPFADDASM